jgi:hypothetical protein
MEDESERAAATAIVMALAGDMDRAMAITNQENTVDLIASGYEWICPHCERYNLEIEVTSRVTCVGCGKTFETNPPEHALGS